MARFPLLDHLPRRAAGPTGVRVWSEGSERSLLRRPVLMASALLLATAWLAIVAVSFTSHDAQTQRTLASARAGGEMLTAMLDQESGVRGYEDSGRAAFLEPYRSGRARFARVEATVRASFASSPDVLRALSAQGASATAWQREAAQDVAAVGGPGGASRSAPDQLGRRASMDAFRVANARLETGLRREAARRLEGLRERTILAVVALSGLLALLAGVALRAAGRRERRTDARLRALVENSPDLISVVDADTRTLYQSPAVTEMLGYGRHELDGHRMADLVHPDDRARVMANFAHMLEHPRVSDGPTDVRWRHADGSYRWVETARNNLLADPHIRGVVLNTRDVGERRALADELAHQAFHDRLTGLPNRALFEDRLGHTLASAGRSGSTTAVLFVDLDNFKTVNDSLGHAGGDELLIRAAERLAASVRGGDTVARFGGDEFAVLLDGAEAPERALVAAERILGGLDDPLAVGERRVALRASVGLAVAEPGEGAAEVLRNADLALYRAKDTGKGMVCRYDPEMYADAMRRLELESELSAALERNEFLLHYQPVFLVASGEVGGFEALLRWQHPTRGLLAPGAFLELAESSGLIAPIGRWAIGEACRQMAEWQRRHGRGLNVGVNLSPVELEQADLLDVVAGALETAGLAARHLVVELTEEAVGRDFAATTGALHALTALGVQIAVDDFGTGYSSMSRLTELPIHGLKIPKPFIDGVADHDDDFAVARGIVELGHHLGLGLVAEGIETAEQLDCVRAMGCDLAQGYHLGRPAPADHFDALLPTSVGAGPAGRPRRRIRVGSAFSSSRA